MPNYEVALSYGGDFQVQPNGDLVLVSDTLASPAATSQRVAFLVLTNPTLYDSDGNPIARPDDLFNPTYGSGIKELVGDDPNAETQLAIQARIVAGLRTDPNVALTPTPTGVLSVNSPGNVTLEVTANAITGQALAVPTLQLTNSGS